MTDIFAELSSNYSRLTSGRFTHPNRFPVDSNFPSQEDVPTRKWSNTSDADEGVNPTSMDINMLLGRTLEMIDVTAEVNELSELIQELRIQRKSIDDIRRSIDDIIRD